MGCTAQIYTKNNISWTASPRQIFDYIALNLDFECAGMWQAMINQAETFRCSVEWLKKRAKRCQKTIAAKLKRLIELGAVERKFTRNDSGQILGSYYIARPIPSQYIADQTLDQEPPPPENPKLELVETYAKNVDKLSRSNTSPKRKKVPPITIRNLPSNKTNHTSANTTPTPQISRNSNIYKVEQNMTGCGVGEIHLNMFFDLLCDAFPDSKDPRANPRNRNGSFKQFKIAFRRLNYDQCAYFLDFLLNDIALRRKSCIHWACEEDIPQVYAYLKEQRWTLPIDWKCHQERSEAISQAPSINPRLDNQTRSDGRKNVIQPKKIGPPEWARGFLE